MDERSSISTPDQTIQPEKAQMEQKEPGKDTSEGQGQPEQPNSSPQPASELPVDTGKPYSTFGGTAKRLIISAASLAAFFSPLSSQIYLPSLNVIAKALDVSNSKINLSVTTYMILQGLAPTMIAGFSEHAGRRLAYFLCFPIYIAANIGLALQRNYAALLVLRCLQSAGSSGTVALSNGVVADMVTSEERGTYIGYSQLGSILGPAVGPIMGGLISQFAGWPWIFWFLTIFSSCFFLGMALFFPETCRKVVGDGSIPPPKLNKSLTSFWRERKRQKAGIPIDEAQQEACAKQYWVRFPNPLSTLVIVADKEAGLLLFCNGFVVACLVAVSTGVPSQFHEIYGFNELEVSLVFLPFSFGSLVSAFTTGKIVNWNYRRHAKRLGFPLVKNRQQDLTNFPIENARLEVALPLTYLGSVAMIAYGWVIHFETNLAGPLILLAIIGYSIVASYQTTAILLVDIHPGRPATATAANNLIRCLLSAGASAVIIPMLNAIGRGWTYTLISIIWLLSSPCCIMLMKFGPRWRREKKLREEKKRAEKEGTMDAKAEDVKSIDRSEKVDEIVEPVVEIDTLKEISRESLEAKIATEEKGPVPGHLGSDRL